MVEKKSQKEKEKLAAIKSTILMEGRGSNKDKDKVDIKNLIN